MGGFGSGRWHCEATRTTVEACLRLSADKLTRDKLLRPGVRDSGTLTWSNTATGEKLSTAGFEVDTLPGSTPPWLRLHYTIKRSGEAIDYKVPLTSTRTPWGALRWWFVCALSAGGRYCGRRVGKLYLPPGGRYYGCRHCYRLTYTSCNESRRNDAIYKLLARDLGWDPADVKRLWRQMR